MPSKKKANDTSDAEKDDNTCTWTAAEEAAMIVELREHRDKQTGTGFRSVVWQAVARMLKEKFPTPTGAEKTPDKCMSKYAKMKKIYKILYTLSDKSGWGWDPIKNVIKVEDDVWATYVAAHAKHKQYRNKTFPCFADMAELMGDKFATGRTVVLVGNTAAAAAAAPGQPASELEDDSGDESSAENTPGEGSENSTGTKRKAAEELPNPKLKISRARASTSGALTAMSDAIGSVASAIADMSGPSTAGVDASPVRRARAIKSATQQKDFLGVKTTGRALKLLRQSTSAVDTFNELADADRDLLKEWLESELDDM